MDYLHISFIAYMTVNVFVAGMYFGESRDEIDGKSDLLWVVFGCVVAALFGAPVLLFAIARQLWEDHSSALQIRFFISYLFTRKWHNMTEDQLRWMNQTAKEGNSIRARVWRYGLRLINKRNGYTPAA